MAFTKIVGAGIHTLSNVHTHNINSSGIITATQFVGIFTGTDGNFSGNLDVGGNVSIGGSLTVNGDFTTLNTTLREVEILNVDANSSESAGIITQRGSGDILNLFDTNTEVFTVKDGGNVGIGSQSPATLLNLMSNNPLIRLTDSDNGGYSAIGGEGGNLYLYTNSSSRDFIFRGSNEVARLTGDGYFGIGVNATNPGHNIVSHIGSNTAYNGNVINNTALAIGNVNSTANTNSVGIYMYSDGNGRGVVGLNCLSNSTGSSADFTIQTRHSGSLFERLRITSSGRIGVNNNNPDSNFRVDCAGSVRIGTGSYGSRLQFSRSGLGDELVIGLDGYGNSTTNEATIQSSILSPRPLVFATNNTERLRIHSNGNLGVNVADPKSKLHLPVNEDVRVGGQNGGTAQVQNEITYSSGYTGVHWMFESNQSVSWCFDGVMIVNGSGSSSYGSEIVKITIVYSREYGALNSGDTHRNGSSSYNIETLGHDQVGLNPSAGSISVTEETNPDGAGSTRSLFKLSWSASGQSVGVVSRLVGNFHWGTPSGGGSVEIQDKDGNIYWNSNP